MDERELMVDVFEAEEEDGGETVVDTRLEL